MMAKQERITTLRATTAKVVSLFLCFFLSITALQSQSPSTQGTDFYLTYPYNYEDIGDIKVIVTGQRACTGRVENPRTGWYTTFSVSPSQVTNVVIPSAQGYNNDIGVFNHGLHISTTDTVSVYASNYYEASFDVANVLPTSALRDSYIVQTYENNDYSWSLFSIVAVEDNTVVDIVPTTIPDDRYNLSPYSVTLQAGQVYHSGCSAYGSMSGTTIKSRDCKRIAVFASSSVAFVPSLNVCCGDFLFEQLMPVDYHGRHFVVTSSAMRNEDRVLVTASEDNCVIRSGSQVLGTLNAGQTGEFYINETVGASYIETSTPAQVYLYFTGGSNDESQMGDPSMVLINPIEQQISKITFGTFTTNIISDHFVNVVTPTEAVATMRLDGVSVSRYFSVVAGNNAYSYARIPISYGAHTLSNSNGGFVAHVYGLGAYESYSYTVGSNAVNLSSSLDISGTSFYSSGLAGVCSGQSADFSLISDLNITSTRWLFPDGSSANGRQVSHSFPTAGTQTVKVIYTSSEGQCANRVDSLSASVFVRGVGEGHTTKSICSGASYRWNGTSYDAQGNYTKLLHTAEGCDSNDHLHINVTPVITASVSEECADNALPHRYGGRSFYGDIDTVFSFTTASGCDSVVNYSLRVWHGVVTRLDTTVCSDALPVVWHGVTFRAAGTKTLDRTTAHGADSTVSLTLKVLSTSSSRYRDTVVENALPHRFGGIRFTQAVADTTLHRTNSVGCDSAIRYSLVVYRNVAVTLDSTLCENNLPIRWNGKTFRAAGTQSATLTGAHGVDSVVTMRLTVLHNSSVTIRDTVVENNLPVRFANLRFGDAQQDTLILSTNRVGCDSLITYSLHVWRNRSTDKDTSVCSNTLPFTWQGKTVRSSGEVMAHLSTTHGADSIVTLHVATRNVSRSMRRDTIVQNRLPYTFAGVTFTAAQRDTTLRRTNSVGCDSLITFSLFVYRNVEVAADSVVCENYLPVRWNGKTFRSAGTQRAVLTGAHGIDSTVAMTLSVLRNSSAVVFDSVAENRLPVLFAGHRFATDVDDTVIVMTNAAGCDSMVHYSLYVWRNVSTIVDSVVCENDTPIRWNGLTLSESDTQQVTLVGRGGVDSVATLRLTVLRNSTYEEHDTIVENSLPFRFADIVFSSEQGDTAIVRRNAAGCDSLIRFSLHVYWNYRIRYDTVVCDNHLPVVWRGIEFSHGELKQQYLRASTGADSTVTLVFKVNPTYDVPLQTAVCASSSLVVGDTAISTEGHYDFLLSSVNGCDSAVRITLSVFDTYSKTFYDTVCSNHPRHFEGDFLDRSGTYSSTLTSSDGCDSMLTLHLVVKQAYFDTDNYVLCYGDTLLWIDSVRYFATTDGQRVRYMAVNGCDSVRYLDLVVDNPVRAAIYASPLLVSDEAQPVQLADVSGNSVARQWFVDGMVTDSMETFLFNFPAYADSVKVFLLASSAVGCSDTATVVIRSDFARLWVPNVFTPTRIDNNRFAVAAPPLSFFEMQIYNRQGLLVFSSTDPTAAWDGTYQGVLCPQAAYAYRITYATIYQPRSRRTLTGIVTLLR